MASAFNLDSTTGAIRFPPLITIPPTREEKFTHSILNRNLGEMDLDSDDDDMDVELILFVTEEYFAKYSKPSAKGLFKAIMHSICSTNDSRHSISTEQNRRFRELLAYRSVSSSSGRPRDSRN